MLSSYVSDGLFRLPRHFPQDQELPTSPLLEKGSVLEMLSSSPSRP
uniref:Uncharacterized protein n=1 Tax=Utricularia reniformis TaxID=192314 RepID=A0A1Y0B0N6_9LAMI|nr:hypothetical protein AEK19_MT0686 [Utricularia reniformis]ART30934.1 hypothetical protein AEK19_MT0686 [Utricularia reniformis]